MICLIICDFIELGLTLAMLLIIASPPAISLVICILSPPAIFLIIAVILLLRHPAMFLIICELVPPVDVAAIAPIMLKPAIICGLRGWLLSAIPSVIAALFLSAIT